jgi:hypothetical protein
MPNCLIQKETVCFCRIIQSLGDGELNMKGHPELFTWFVSTWIVLGLVSFWLFFLNKNAAQKKRLLPILIIGTGILFAGFVFLMTGELWVMLFVIPAVILISISNLRRIKICEACGRTVYNNVWFSKMEYCSKCKAKLP